MNSTLTDLVAAIEWLKNEHESNKYALGYMAECSTHEDYKTDHVETILNSVVSGNLSPASSGPVEAAAKVLLDQPYTVMRKAFDAMDKMQGEGADNIMSSALRALSGEKT